MPIPIDNCVLRESRTTPLSRLKCLIRFLVLLLESRKLKAETFEIPKRKDPWTKGIHCGKINRFTCEFI